MFCQSHLYPKTQLAYVHKVCKTQLIYGKFLNDQNMGFVSQGRIWTVSQNCNLRESLVSFVVIN